jgi:ribose/xylose/arabinose/galactoside ABC-type transport system permease subunit
MIRLNTIPRLSKIPGPTTIRTLIRDQRFILVVFFVAINLFFGLQAPHFFTTHNYSNMLRQSAMIVITGSAATLLMMSGNFDLSTGSNVAASGLLYSYLAVGGMSLPLAALISIGAGSCFGIVNGFLVTRIGFPPFISSLGLMYVGRGLALAAANGRSIREGLPPDFGDLAMNSFLGIPIPIIIVAVVLVVFWVIERKTLLGKYALAIGGNRTAAEFSGLNTGRIVFWIYIMVGAFAGFSGVLTASRIGAGDPRMGTGFEFDVILAILLGGTSLSGGKGSVLGMFLGAIIVVILGNGLGMLNVLTFWQSILKGLVLVLAIAINKGLQK